MYGLIVKMTIVPGKREQMINLLKESAAGMPGCMSYVVAEDTADENVIWITEVWDSAGNHDASLSLSSVKKAISQAKQMVSGFDRIAVTTPVWGIGLQSTPRH